MLGLAVARALAVQGAISDYGDEVYVGIVQRRKKTLRREIGVNLVLSKHHLSVNINI